jgi:molybdopterin-guanine dinucleotide biosynthesis protein A
VNCISPNPGLPVFQLSGKTQGERGEFVQRLMAELDRRLFCRVVLKQVAYRNLSQYALQLLVKQYDLVIVDAGIDIPGRLCRAGGHEQPVQDSIVWTGEDDSAIQGITDLTDRMVEVMDDCVRKTPVWGCVLIGGKSSRMGRPKHLIEDKNKITWLERTTKILRPLVDGLVVSGTGLLPENLNDISRLADIPGVAGPLTGILAASRWQPMVTWVLVACDMPHITPEAIHWLLSGRRAGWWGRVPRLAEKKYCEPLFAWYDFRAAQLFEEQLFDGNMRIGGVASHPQIENPVIPESLRSGWKNINTSDQLSIEVI